MKRQMRHILVAVADVDHAPRSELRKAGALAKASGASVELFHAIDAPDPGRSYPETATQASVTRQRAAMVARSQARLERFARDPSFQGVKVTCAAAWDHPVYDAIGRRALATRSDLVIAASRGHRFGTRLVLRNTDWELIRHCPVPLLLVKSRRQYQRPTVVTAVDPFHAHAKPANLDSQLLAAADQLTALLKGTLHVFHAYMPLPVFEPTPFSGPALEVYDPEVEAWHRQQVAQAINKLAENAGIPRTQRHIAMGDVAGELSVLTRRTRCSIVVMGAVSRSALKRFFIGNTAEHVLDRVACDVLIVKPRNFAPSVTHSARVGTAARPRAAAAPTVASRLKRDSTVTTGRVVLPPLF
jgi:universal stress protein E